MKRDWKRAGLRVWSKTGVLFILLFALTNLAQSPITTPKAHFGFNIGDDYSLANYTRTIAYWQTLDRESDRVSLLDIGRTSEGRTMTMAIVTSPANHARLDSYRDIARRLSKAENLTDSQARTLAAEGKAIVWIDGGLHATETVGVQQLTETLYRLTSTNDPETQRFLNDVIVLFCIANPDGMELVSNWYMRETDATRRSLAGIPTLYHKYAGHDDNRDFYMSALSETRAINTVLYRDWFPQIVYDHHQTGPEGTVMFSPPFRDPFNFNIDPLVITMVDEVGGAMHSRFAAEDKPGVVSRSAATYSTWWNGGMRTSPYFHNMIGILTETIGNPTPMQIPFVPNRQLPKGDNPFPVAPQTWHFRQSIEYSVTANLAVIDYASRNRDRLLLNMYRMGRNSIERGSRDNWTTTPATLTGVSASTGFQALRKPENRDARGYVIPSDQPDFLTATKFVNALILNGVDVLRATSDFRIAARAYPAGSFVVKTAQAFRPQILDMFEPQRHPDDFAYPGGPPVPPYDNAGWTLAYQMGVRFDRILEGFEGPFVGVAPDLRPAPGAITQVERPAGYLFTHEANDAFVGVNRLLAAGETVYWLNEEYSNNGRTWRAGSHYVRAGVGTLRLLQQLAQDTGLSFQAVPRAPDRDALQLRSVRIALWDQYGGSAPSGWARLVLEQFEFPYTVVYPRTLDEGKLDEQFDVLILPADATFSATEPRPRNVLPEYADRAGSLTTAVTVPRLKSFLEKGGTVLAIGNASNLGSHLGVPVTSAVAGLPTARFYVPGSILQAQVEKGGPVTFGLPDQVDVFFDRSPSFKLGENAQRSGVRSLAGFNTEKPLRSGWALGQETLKDTSAVVEASVGKGKLVLYGPNILFRAQPHGNFKLLFNAIYAGHAQPVDLR
ncbi:MAG TPA: M14 metallopeptidase family protein [Terriglobia bacterium]|nr:M14 metallopeptidase family protein [Terriglobia bacterium]